MNLPAGIDLAFEGKVLRIVNQWGEPWFVLADVCKALGIGNVTEAARFLDADDKAEFSLTEVRSKQRRKMIIVSEPGAMQIILRSDAAISPGTFAYRFRRWVTHEVLPSIRRHGTYPPPPEPEFVALPAPLPVVETRQARFLQECERLAAEQGVPMLDLFKHIVSPAQFKGMANGAGDLDKLLTREMRWVGFMNMGMDMPYVLTGNRSLTSPPA
ncbi:BRO family protein [Novosphingobium sp.]|uniref:BRO-N domain-containing protein n=1 Tax=Novosphingobium sp. TaxID=1874826 RepID=UPI002610824E|nr:BRO family protein [Novosphingobium sp.]